MEEGEVVNEGWLIKSPPQKRFPRAVSIQFLTSHSRDRAPSARSVAGVEGGGALLEGGWNRVQDRAGCGPVWVVV